MVGYKQPSTTIYNSAIHHQQAVSSRMEVTTSHKSSYRIPRKDSRRPVDDKVHKAVKELKQLKEELTQQHDSHMRKLNRIINKLYDSN